MPNGKPGDHPFTDILHYGQSEFGQPIDGMVKQMAEHPLFFKVKNEVADLLWRTSPIGRQPEKAALLAEAEAALEEIGKMLSQMDGSE